MQKNYDDLVEYVDPNNMYQLQKTSESSYISEFLDMPKIVITDYLIHEYNTRSIFPFDRNAWDILSTHVKNLWPDLNEPIASSSPRCPPHYEELDLVICGGPNGNRLAELLNLYFSESETETFYFKRIQSPTAPIGQRKMLDGPRDFVIGHSRFQDIAIPYPQDGKTDFGLFYIGKNPSSPQRHLIWVAGLGGCGTVAAAKALITEHLYIADQLSKGRQYVSGLAKCEYISGGDWTGVNVTAILLSLGS